MTPIPQTMTAIAVQGGKGPAQALHAIQAPTPLPKAGEVLIRVRAAGVNRPDILQRKGQYPPPPGASEIIGLEVAGEVVALGEGARRWQVGDTVCALLAGGGYAQYVAVDARHALPIPQGLSVLEAAALPETVFTVFTNVYERGRLAAGETFMVHGATSGIGVTAIGLAKATGARVIATSRGADKAAKALALGADISIDTLAQDFEAVARADGGVDVILDMVGGDFIAKGLSALKPDGRLVMIAVQGGAKAEINLPQLLVNRLTLTASTLRARKPDEKARLARAVEDQIWPLIEAGRFKPLIDRTFPLTEAAAAHAYLESGTHVGKVMLEG
jgi:putative PIG3 family NAD(P)H quinone oxidoreductase